MDSQIARLIALEEKRQSNVLEMIPSENYASAAVRTAVGSVFINKYAEGQAGKRYYQGNAVVDELETVCKTRALALFGLSSDAWGVNVQALSGSPANLAIISALLVPNEKIFSMYLPDGGHLSHGWQLPDKKVTIQSKFWDVEFYHVDKKTRVFDYDQIQEQAKAYKPKLLISGGTAYPREIDHKRMSEIAHSVGAYYLADVSHEAGLIAGGANVSPFAYADVVMMTTHKTLRGPRGAMIFSKKELSTLIDQSVFPSLQGGPHEHTIAGIAVALGEAKTPAFSRYTKQVVKNAQQLADIFIEAGFDVVSGGTDKHLVLIDLRTIDASAWVVAWALEFAGIVVNRNTVPFDTGSSVYPSGIRLGTPAVTTRGMGENEMKKIGAWIIEVVREVAHYRMPETKESRILFLSKVKHELSGNARLLAVRKHVEVLCSEFPIS
ncbi:serine hydroxymethyltransferase [Candidatus Woesebacteria bacterium]|jgi:glycine hydroxymethyltransferase|nr:serine hydroxymethyltransferase [Candidatus Woesebacteria bacterium]